MAYDINKDGVTQSLLGDYLDCRQKAAFKIDGYRQEHLKDALVYGSITHEALEAIHSGKKFMPAITEYLPETGDPDEYPKLPAMKEEIAILMAAYLRYNKIRDKKKNTIAVEKKFAVEFNGALLRGKIDWAYKLKGELWIADHKTAGQISSETLQHSLLTNLQIQFYWIAAQIVFKMPVAGFMYNIIRKPRHKTLQALQKDLAARPEHFFDHRHEVRLSKKEFKTAKKELQYKLDEYRMWLNGGLATFRNGKACTGRGWSCGYLPICAARDYTGFIQSDVIFPELEG